MLIIGHRGCPAYEPENTLRGFARALSMGADMLEFDVYLLPGGEVVVFHDRLLDRVTNGQGAIKTQDFLSLRQLDAGHGERIPSLQEVLDLVDRRVPVIIEMKQPGLAGPLAAIIKQYVEERGWPADYFIVSSFHHPELHAFKTQHAPHIRTGANTSVVPLELAVFALDLEAYVVVADIDSVDQAFVNDAHRRGLPVYVFTINSYDDTREMLRLGVDGVFSNAPDVSRRAFEEWTARRQP